MTNILLWKRMNLLHFYCYHMCIFAVSKWGCSPQWLTCLAFPKSPATQAVQVCDYTHDTHCWNPPDGTRGHAVVSENWLVPSQTKYLRKGNKTQKDADEGRWSGEGANSPQHPEQMKSMRFMWVQRINLLHLLVASYVWISNQWFTPAARPFVLM